MEHGVEAALHDVAVHIAAGADTHGWWLSVADTGAGLREGAPPGTGLANLRERLAMFYGTAARLEIAENVPCGVVVTVRCPAEANS